MNGRGVLENTERSELVPLSDSLAGIVSIDIERLGGTPCFVGTRVPVRYMFEYLTSGKSLETFLEDFEGVSREEVVAALEEACRRLLEGLPHQ